MLDWLCPPTIDPLQDYESYKEMLTVNTATWIFQHPAYIEWDSSTQSFLWINGKSTVLTDTLTYFSGSRQDNVGVHPSSNPSNVYSCSIFERLQTQNREGISSAVTVFFCDGNVAEKKVPRYIFGSILRQLLMCISLDANSQHLSRLRQLRDSNNLKSSIISDIIKTIKSLAQMSGLIIIVDGLDECSAPTEICVALSELGMTNIKVLCTSRVEREIGDAFGQHTQMELDDALVQADIAVYIDWRMSNNRGLQKIKPRLKQEIKERLLGQSNGRYLHY